jgi:hypothetical protein
MELHGKNVINEQMLILKISETNIMKFGLRLKEKYVIQNLIAD